MSTAAPPLTIRNPAIGDVVTFVETAANGGPTVLEIELAPNSGNAVHVHRAFDEQFEVLSGELTLRVGRMTLKLGPRANAVARAGIPHAFANRTELPVRFRVRLTPGHSGFERSLRIAYGLAEDGLVRKGGIPRSLTHVALLATMSDTYPVGAFTALAPLFERLATRARARGVEQELVARYVVSAEPQQLP